ncbi:murein biosynthesis integral membrane protein MurJ [Nocardioides sp. dk4132]|uniref:murein biosynthesis integral membrane protein MurJ n=1 Tax=unclassified Nocardioides TaxID=2615069 RepID=UPI0012976D01|nr:MULTISPECIES: murein biosynthesis integral membrane protein MurJ [unclassified Nocardioides]MQW77050.1 murein biosynthesis integral membrane protein MurJ [Nocardioides sp. dk4132]QGA09455.1 murein biosynthesis integral membrane protein MurJ [Nocardioides sp. dk884]
MSEPSTDVREEDRKILASSAVMAAGTVVSRASGFVRTALLAAALGAGLHADQFTIANTVPNALYILLAGGVFNAVMVPQLVRAMKHDPDGGVAYTNRILTLAGLFLALVTLVLVLAAPLVMDLYLSEQYGQASLAAQRDSAIDLARYCLPQVFFYGMFVLVGQILNSRGRFGPMMWAPIANNLISIAVLVAYLMSFGAAEGAGADAAYTVDEELLIGLGSTAGIVAQFLILIPYLRATGFRFRPRFDFRGTGLGHTLRLGMWTVLFVVVNQIAYTVVVNLASSGAADGGTGYTVYSFAFLIVMVPHSVITVSLATAVLPRLSRQAADGDLTALGRSLGGTLRTALAVMVPFAALLPLVAPELARILFGFGASADSIGAYAPTLAVFGPGILLFTVHYLVLRGFYALEQTRTVCLNQCWVALTNIVVALVAVRAVDPEHTAPALAAAYAASYLVGSVLSYGVLRRRIGTLDDARLVRFLVRLVLITVLTTAVAAVPALTLDRWSGTDSWPGAVLVAGVTLGVAGVVYLLLARAFRLREVTDVIETITRRLPGTRRKDRGLP